MLPINIIHDIAKHLLDTSEDPATMAEMRELVRAWLSAHPTVPFTVKTIDDQLLMMVDDQLHAQAEAIFGVGSCNFLKDRPDGRKAALGSKADVKREKEAWDDAEKHAGNVEDLVSQAENGPQSAEDAEEDALGHELPPKPQTIQTAEHVAREVHELLEAALSHGELGLLDVQKSGLTITVVTAGGIYEIATRKVR